MMEGMLGKNANSFVKWCLRSKIECVHLYIFSKLYLHNVLKNKEIFFPFSQYCNYVFHFLIFYSAQWGVYMHRRRRHNEGGVWVFKIPKSKEEKCGWIGLCLLLTYTTYLTQIIQQILTFTTYNYNLVINFQLLQNYLDLAIYF